MGRGKWKVEGERKSKMEGDRGGERKCGGGGGERKGIVGRKSKLRWRREGRFVEGGREVEDESGWCRRKGEFDREGQGESGSG